MTARKKQRRVSKRVLSKEEIAVRAEGRALAEAFDALNRLEWSAARRRVLRWLLDALDVKLEHLRREQ